jgi:two-component system, response regulator PdtaR
MRSLCRLRAVLSQFGVGCIVGEPNGKPDVLSLPKTILVVDDDVFTRLAIADDLMDAGFRVIQAASADEALKVLQSAAIAVDLVTTDIHMPGSMDGLGLARRLRAFQPQLKIIVLSSDAEAARSSGAGDVFIDKPHWSPDLIGRVNQLLGLKNDNDND